VQTVAGASADPLRWFGALPPPSLKQAQRHFKQALALAVEAANLQSELAGVQARMKFLRRMADKMEGKTGILGADCSI